MKGFKEKLLEKIEEGQREHDTIMKKPGSLEYQAHVRKTGLGLLFAGLVFAGVSYGEWYFFDTIHFIFPIASTVLVLAGLGILITKKLPQS